MGANNETLEELEDEELEEEEVDVEEDPEEEIDEDAEPNEEEEPDEDADKWEITNENGTVEKLSTDDLIKEIIEARELKKTIPDKLRDYDKVVESLKGWSSDPLFSAVEKARRQGIPEREILESCLEVLKQNEPQDGSTIEDETTSQIKKLEREIISLKQHNETKAREQQLEALRTTNLSYNNTVLVNALNKMGYSVDDVSDEQSQMKIIEAFSGLFGKEARLHDGKMTDYQATVIVKEALGQKKGATPTKTSNDLAKKIMTQVKAPKVFGAKPSIMEERTTRYQAKPQEQTKAIDRLFKF